MIRRLITLCTLLPATAFMAACTVDSDESVPPVTETAFKARFHPSAALIPFPNDIWRAGSTDGTLNIYQGNEAFDSDPLIGQVEQMNLLDGFGLNSAIYADFTEPLNESTIALGQTVFVFNVTNPAAPAPVTTFDVGTAGFQNGRSVVEIVPTAPLSPLNTYAVILTDNISSTGGASASADIAFQAMLDAHAAGADSIGDDATLTAIYTQMVGPLLNLADGAGIGAENVVAAWTFTTQSVGNSLELIQAMASDQASAFVPILRDPANPGAGIRTAGELMMPASDLDGDGTPDIGMNADIYSGVIELPYYLASDELLDGYWEPVEASCQTAIAAELIEDASASTTAFCPLPQVKQTVAVPVLISVPNSGCGGAINGVAIFQHGITQNRSNLLPVAGALAQGCQAGIAIDLPLHGIADVESPLFAAASNPLYAALENVAPGITDNLIEQTFNLDVNDDDEIDASGSHFINLSSPITARESMRQAAANLIHLVATIPTIDYNIALDGGASGADFDGLPVRFVGMSLGGIAGTPFLGVDDTVDAAVLAVSGGLVTSLLRESASIFPSIEAGLADQGLVSGMRFFEEFFRNAQTLIDGGDAINYAAAANTDRNILMFSVIGGGGVNPDQVVPNSSTQALADAMGLQRTGPGNYGPDPEGIDAFVRFVAGSHSSLLDPSASQAVTQEMQTQMTAFVASGGMQLPVGSVDPSVIAPGD